MKEEVKENFLKKKGQLMRNKNYKEDLIFGKKV